MLTIRAAQMEVLGRHMAARFEAEMAAHLRACFPEAVAADSDEQLRALVRDGARRAAAHGIVAERDICGYVDLMIVLAPGFDSDPRFPWAQRILGPGGPSAPSDKIAHLFAAADMHLRAASSTPR